MRYLLLLCFLLSGCTVKYSQPVILEHYTYQDWQERQARQQELEYQWQEKQARQQELEYQKLEYYRQQTQRYNEEIAQKEIR